MAISYRAAQTLIKRGDEGRLGTELDEGLDPNLANGNGWTLLMLAAVEGSVPLGHQLLAKGAEINAKNRSDETALSLAAGKGHVPFLQLLLEHGASKDAKPHGKTLSEWLTSASSLTEPQLAELLQLLGV